MPFIPHTEADVASMLTAIGADSIEALFDEIPPDLRSARLERVPAGLSEMQVTRLMNERAAEPPLLNFIGAGAYEHHIPAAVWQIVGRGEFYTSYTPYQAEASQGTLQLLWEFQSMMVALTGMDVSNASLYDGATALSEAILMAVRANKAGHKRVLVPRSLHPLYRKAAAAIVRTQGIELVEVPFDRASGITDPAAFDAGLAAGAAGVVVPQPNFFGALEEVDALTERAQGAGALAIAVCNPLALALLEAPGRWGSRGADICCGEAQPFGLPLSGGGPYLGYLTCKQALVRQMPGRIVGRTVDLDGRTGFALTLQAREQHIRRSKATSNICTNQGLMVTAATVYLALTGAEGLARIAAASHANTVALRDMLCEIPGVSRAFAGPVFHEAALKVPQPAAALLPALRRAGILGGYDLSDDYPELGQALLVCATETKTRDDLERYARALRAAAA